MILSHSSDVMSRKLWRMLMPALLMRTSTRPSGGGRSAKAACHLLLVRDIGVPRPRLAWQLDGICLAPLGITIEHNRPATPLPDTPQLRHRSLAPPVIKTRFLSALAFGFLETNKMEKSG